MDINQNRASVYLYSKKYFLPLVVWILVYCSFIPSLHFDFVLWDDDASFLENEKYRGLTADHLQWMFTTFHMGHYQPLSWVTLGLDYSLWGMDASGYHFTNTLLHATSAVFLYFLILLVFQKKRYADSPKLLWAACLGALFYAVHPLRVESVAWITERRDVLSGFFYLLTILCYLKMARLRAEQKGWIFWHFVSLVFFLFSLLSKAWGITLPLLLVLLDFYVWERRQTLSIKALLLEKIPYCLLAGIFALLAFTAQKNTGAVIPLAHLELGQRLAQAAYGICFYLTRAIVPYPLAPVYLLDAKILYQPVFLASLGAVVIITLGLFYYRREHKNILLAWIAYIIILLPVLGLTQAGIQLVADRYTYLSFLPLILLFSAFLHNLSFASKAKFYLGHSTLALALLGSFYLTQIQLHHWKDSFSLWSYTLQVQHTNPIPYYKLAQIHYEAQEIPEAIFYAEKSLELEPYIYYPQWYPHLTLGKIHLQQNRYDKAIYHLREALKLQPIPKTYLALCRAYIQLGNKDQALSLLENNIQKFSDASLYFTLAALYEDAGQSEKAIKAYEKALELDSALSLAHKRLAALYESAGKPEK